MQELSELNSELRKELNYTIDMEKDGHQQAITVSTIVTVIFLPLLFVASVFGMNTYKIRNMEYKQWAYWCAAVPLTVAVVLASSWWADLLRLPWNANVDVEGAQSPITVATHPIAQCVLDARAGGRLRDRSIDQISAKPLQGFSMKPKKWKIW